MDEPELHAQLLIGQPGGINFEAEFEDNRAVRSYRIVIKPATETQTVEGDGQIPFQYDNTWQLPERCEVEVRQHEVVIPSSVRPGKYHMVVYCTDKAGNQEHTVVPVELVKF